MILLGISWSKPSTAALMIDGRIVASCSEERFNRIKSYDGWPCAAISECLRIAGVSPPQIDYVVWGGQDVFEPNFFLTHRYCTFSIRDYIREQEEYWYPVMYRGQEVDFLKLFPEKIDLEQFPGREHLAPIRHEPSSARRSELLGQLRPHLLTWQLGIPAEKNVFLNHHQCHAAYATCALPHAEPELLVFTLDAFGDGDNATVSLFQNGSLKPLWRTDRLTVGRLYRHATLILNMNLVEHEYKVMGLAPYAKPYHSDAPYQVYARTLAVNGLEIDFPEKPSDSYFYFLERLKGARFDGIAGGVQRFTEDIICQWMGNWMAHTGVRRVAYSGGVSMNVKTNLEILKRCSPDRLLVPGSGGDDSLAIGACYRFALERGEAVEPLSDLYLGTAVTAQDGQAAARQLAQDGKYDIIDHADPRLVAGYLAAGKILGRCTGSMEFGARALGNRSILADPRHYETIRIINDKIKSRDFWMPFAPSVLWERRHAYLDIKDAADYSSMTVAADTTPAGRHNLKAALHPADGTARPHLVVREQNPGYHALISEFERLTGIGAVLNTSFNIHGEPIVCNAADALHVLESTGIDGTILGDTLILKRPQG